MICHILGQRSLLRIQYIMAIIFDRNYRVNDPWVLPAEVFLSVKEPEFGNFTGYFLAKTLPILRELTSNRTYTVTLKIRRSLRARRTERPKEPAFGLKWVQTTSKTLPLITKQSNLKTYRAFQRGSFTFCATNKHKNTRLTSFLMAGP
jgi:hypothetical protein